MGQHTYNVILRRVRELLLPWKSNKYYLLVGVRACVRACGYLGAWACACALVHVALLILQQRACAILRRHLWALVRHYIFRHYITNGAIFVKTLLNIKYVF
jgi:hypothetical protein